MSEHRLITSMMRPFFRKGQAAQFTLPGILNESSRILCIDSGDLAELVFHVPLVKAIRKNYPAARIDFLVPEKHEPLLVPSGLVKQCIVYKESQLNPWRPAYASLLRQLGKGHYDMAVVLTRNAAPRLELAALASGASLRLGPSHEDSWPAVNFEIRLPEGSGQYFGDRILSAGPFLGLTARDMNSRWPLPMELVRQTAQQVHFHKPNPDQILIGVEPGVSKTGHKLELENLHFLVRQMATHYICRVIPLGKPNDSGLLKKFELKLSDTPLGLSRETLMDNVLILSQCDLFLAGNTDLFHFSVALGVPTIGLFSKDELPSWIPGNRKRVRVLTLDKAGKVDLETLMEAVETVTDGRTTKAAKVIDPVVGGNPEQPGSPPSQTSHD
ncbi:MAG: glycosyltransferase family 9 protein [bacterium]|nr:glycosyltransferase family 9 protein [bacterium]